ncbi:MAG: biotin--[acetyl-CoA-carboxylase] ligase [Bacteroidales bacterium]
MKIEYRKYEQLASTNHEMAKIGDNLATNTVIYTDNQVAGVGQRGASWESEPNKNITMSMLLRPTTILPYQQFYISEGVSLAIIKVLSKYANGFSIKWPNDIYYKDSKICGILIEHTLMSNKIQRTIVGIGLNINQNIFLSDAPNPISLLNIIAREINIVEVLEELAHEIVTICNFTSDYSFEQLHTNYLHNLYRNDGEFHTFTTPSRGEFQAKITNIKPTGEFILTDTENIEHSYLFKEVAFKI